jgi:hypothetical protein
MQGVHFLKNMLQGTENLFIKAISDGFGK